MILAKEIFLAVLEKDDSGRTRLNEFARAPVVVPEMLKVSALFDVICGGHTHMAFVVDEYGEFVGLVTLADFLEETVGEIIDEKDAPEEPLVAPQPGGGWQASGLASLTNIARGIGLSAPAGLNANTIFGLLMQRLPNIDDHVIEDGFRIRVLGMRDHHVDVDQVHIEKVEDTAHGDETPVLAASDKTDS
ncbi:MAG: CBS domain containing-hemolysin-like protein [Gammaproteobacteria bacterium]